MNCWWRQQSSKVWDIHKQSIVSHPQYATVAAGTAVQPEVPPILQACKDSTSSPSQWPPHQSTVVQPELHPANTRTAWTTVSRTSQHNSASANKSASLPQTQPCQKSTSVIGDPSSEPNLSCARSTPESLLITPSQESPKTTAKRTTLPMGKTKRIKTSVVGASNTRNIHKFVKSEETDTVVWTNPRCRMQDLENRAHHMIAKDTDLAIIHLGTNDALNSEAEGQCLLNCSDALDCLESTTGDTPLLMCSVPPTRIARGQRRVQMINELIKFKCNKSNKMKFVDTGLTLSDIRKDGVHLTTAGKPKLGSVMRRAVQDFPAHQHRMSLWSMLPMQVWTVNVLIKLLHLQICMVSLQ